MILTDWCKFIGQAPGFESYYKRRYGLSYKESIMRVAQRKGIAL